MFAKQWNRLITAFLSVTLLAASVLPTRAQEGAAASATTGKGPIVVGSKEDTENTILAKMFVLLLRNAGFEVEDKTASGDSQAVRTALENGEISLYPEYTGTAIALFHNLPASALPSDDERVYILAKSLDAEKGFTWLQRIKFNNTYTLMVRQELVDQGIKSLQELATYMKDNEASLRICVESEWYSREQDGLKGLEDRYGFAFKEENILFMDLNQAYEALRDNKCDVAEGLRTDGRGATGEFTQLIDNLGFFPSYYPAPVIRSEVLDQYPEIGPLLDTLADVIDEATMSQLNARADIGADGLPTSGDEETPESVALSFLQSNRLITPPTIKVGSKEFTEQLLLGKMLVLLLQDAGYEVEDRTGIGGSPVVRAALESGEIDLYPEYTGTTLSLHNGLPGSALPTDPNRAWELARSLDERKGLVWLDHAPLNDTYTLMVRQNLIDLGIKSMEDLAKYMNENDSPLSVCIESEFYGREQDGIKGLEQRYGFQFKQDKVQFMDQNETYQALRDGRCDISEGYSTDGRIDAWGFYNLEDTLNFFPIYNPAPVVRKEVLDRFPEVADLFNRLAPYLDNGTMAALNARVDLGEDGVNASGDEETVENVAFSFLRSKRLLKPPPIVVGSEENPQQLILGHMLKYLLQNAGYAAVDKIGTGGVEVLHDAMHEGEIDVYVGLTGQTLATHYGLPGDSLPTTPERVYKLVKVLDAKEDLIWLEPGIFNQTFVLVVGSDLFDQGIRTLEDLAKYMNENDSPLSICLDSNFFSREFDGLPALQEQYGFAFKEENVNLMDSDSVLSALNEQQCDIGQTFSNEGWNATYNFQALTDTLGIFPINTPSVVIRKSILNANPELKGILGEFLKLLKDEDIKALDQRVDEGRDEKADTGDEETPDAVARDFLLQAGLIDLVNLENAPSAPTDGQNTGETKATSDADHSHSEGAESSAPANPEGSDAAEAAPTADITPAEAAPTTTITTTLGITLTESLTETEPITPTTNLSPTAASTPEPTTDQIVVGSANSNEDRLLGQMLIFLLEDAGQQVEDQTGLGEPPEVRAALDKGQIDLYPEYTGRALTTYHDLSVSALPTDVDRSYALATSLDQPQGIAWLNRGFFNHTPALLIQSQLIEQGIQTIGDLGPLFDTDPSALKLCVEEAFAVEQVNGLAALQARYDLPFQPENILITEAEAIYPALRNGDCSIAIGTNTAGVISSWGFQVLEDTLSFFPSNVAAPIIRQAVLDQKPELQNLLGALGTRLADVGVRQLNALMELGPDGEADSADELTPRAVAQLFLCQQELIEDCTGVDPTIELDLPTAAPAAPLTPTITISDVTAITGLDALTATLETATDKITVTLDLTPTTDITTSLVSTATENLEVTEVTRVIVSTPATHGVNARREPNVTAEILQLLPSNTLVPAIGRSNDNTWLLIVLPNGEEAWVFANAMLYRPEATERLPVAP